MYIHKTKIPYTWEFPFTRLKMNLAKSKIPYSDIIRQERDGKYFIDIMFNCGSEEDFFLACLNGKLDITKLNNVLAMYETQQVIRIIT